MTNFIIGFVFVVAIALIIASIINSLTKRKKKLIENKLNKMNEKLNSKKSELRRYIINVSSKKFLFTNFSVENIFQYSFFKHYCESIVLKSVGDKLDKDGYNWLNIDDCISCIDDEMIRNGILNCAIEIFNHDDTVDNHIYSIYADYITSNIYELNKIEKESIEYNSSFGEEPDGDPKLHSRIENQENSSDDEINEDEVDITKLITLNTADIIEDE